MASEAPVINYKVLNSNSYNTWDKPGEFQANALTRQVLNNIVVNAMAPEISNAELINNPIETNAEILDVKSLINNASNKDLKSNKIYMDQKIIDNNLIEAYERYKNLWEIDNPGKKYFEDINKHKTSVWKTMGTYLERRLVIKNNAEIIKDNEDLNNTKYLKN